MDIHKNARLTPHGRAWIVGQVASGQTPKVVAATAGVCPRTVHKWVKRYRHEGLSGLQDRSSRPHRLHKPTPEAIVTQVEALRPERLRVWSSWTTLPPGGRSAVFGAPVADDEHAFHGVRAALACNDRLEELNRDSTMFAGNRLRARIGVNTGEALVGNIGSRKRFNYTVMGDTVNLAARLEGANKIYGTSLLVSEAVRAAIGARIDWREVDLVRVMGRDAAVAIFEPLGLTGETTPGRRALAASYGDALMAYRVGRFAEAAAMFAAIADSDPPARVMAQRARDLQAAPPSSWDGVTTLDTK
jgi:transposase-like protein